MNWIKRLFTRKENARLIWNGTISSKGPEQQGPVTVLACRTDFEKSEFKEGCQNALIDFNTHRPSEKNLNYPVNPYARGYVETFRGLISKTVSEMFMFISDNQHNKDTGAAIEEKYKLKPGVGKDILLAWAAKEEHTACNIFHNRDNYLLLATNDL